MHKDMIIAALGAALCLRCPWIAVCDTQAQAAIWLGISVLLLFFCLFLEEIHEKWEKKRKRARKMQEKIAELRNLGGEWK